MTECTLNKDLAASNGQSAYCYGIRVKSPNQIRILGFRIKHGSTLRLFIHLFHFMPINSLNAAHLPK